MAERLEGPIRMKSDYIGPQDTLVRVWFGTREMFPWTPSTGGGATERRKARPGQKPETVL